MTIKKNITFICTYLLTWVFIFEISRLLFLYANSVFLPSHFVINILKTMWYGLRMDVSFAAYLTLPVCIFLVLRVWFATTLLNAVIKIYSYIISIAVILVVIIDMFTYKAWGFRLDATPLSYLLHPKEAAASAANLPIIGILFVIAASIFLLHVLFKKYFFTQLKSIENTHSIKVKSITTFILLLVAGTLIVPARGGLQQIPLNQSAAYFSNTMFYNHAASNVCWVFLNSVFIINKIDKNPFVVASDVDSSPIRDSLFATKNEILQVVKPTAVQPNVIYILWESFTEKATHIILEGTPVTPHFNALKSEGIYFSNIYATGDRTDKGIVALLSGYPSQPTNSIIKIPRKVVGLPSISQQLQNMHYSTSFYYGGELDFANLKAYVMSSGFKNITTIKNFDKKNLNSKWGAHDDAVALKIIEDIKAAPSPFFCTWLTLSSHEPYETPYISITQKKDDESLFLNSLHYTDSVVFNFINSLKKMPIWQNTIVLISADHGHRLPNTGHKVDDFKMPVLILGGALQKNNIIINNVGSQIDISATVLAQLGLPTDKYVWSKNLLDTTKKDWAYFCFNNGFGLVQPNNYFIFDNVGKKVVEKNGEVSDADIKTGKVFQQLTFQDFLDK